MRYWVMLVSIAVAMHAAFGEFELTGVTVTPHVMAEEMRYRKEPEPADGARVQLFLRNTSDTTIDVDETSRLHFDGRAPSTLLEERVWAWHDTPEAAGGFVIPPDAMTVWTFNGRKLPFGPSGTIPLAFGPEGRPWLSRELAIRSPDCWLSAVTFLGPDDTVYPTSMVVHIANERDDPVTITSCRLWLPPDPMQPRVLLPEPPLPDLVPFNGHDAIPAGDRGGFAACEGGFACGPFR